MVSRKKNQGKARKAAKSKAKEAAEDASLELHMAKLEISNYLTSCTHGSIPLPKGHFCKQFARQFEKHYHNSTSDRLIESLEQAYEATKEKFADVWGDSSKMELAYSSILAVGAQAILNGFTSDARLDATFANYFEQHMAVKLKKTQASMDNPKLAELNDADPHTLISYFRHRIPCSCLDAKYKQVKCTPKMGECCNHKCSLRYNKVERSAMMSCGRCRIAHYCSTQCQKAHWKDHKEECEEYVKEKAEFDLRRHA
jgi:hypothetical protein